MLTIFRNKSKGGESNRRTEIRGEDEIMTVKKCLKCKKPYDVDGFDWGICPSCSQIILENVRKEKMK